MLSEKLKWTARRVLKSRGWVIRHQPTLIDFLHSREIELVLDVGANVGQFASELREWGYRGNIISFEPGAKAFELLKRASADDAAWSIVNSAVGAKPGDLILEVTQSSVFSSIRPQSKAAADYGSDTEIVGREVVPVTTIDLIIGDCTQSKVFVKIDTQGFEREVILGLSQHLDRVAGVQLELPIVQLYEGNWNIVEGIQLMRSKGFEIAQVGAVNHMKEDPVSVTELDCIFRKQVD